MFPEGVFAPGFNLGDTLHGLNRSLNQFTIISNRYVSPLLEVDS